MSADEDTELRDLVAQTLEANGVLGKIRAQLRASVFLALEEQESLQNKTPFANEELKQFVSTKEGQLVTGLVREFLEHFNLEFTLAVFDPETGCGEHYSGRGALARDLDIIDSESTRKLPLLAQVLKRSPNEGPSRRRTSSGAEEGATVVEDSSKESSQDLPTNHIAEARRKFEQYDTDNNGTIEKDELRELFSDMFPNFHRNMLDRYVNDEFRAADRDLSNAIDFEEFLGMYKRLFVLCKSVVSHDVSDIVSPRFSGSSKIPSPRNSRREDDEEDKSSEATGGAGSSVNNKNKKNLDGDKKDSKNVFKLPTTDTLQQSDPDDDPFFDDPLPVNNNTKTFSRVKPANLKVNVPPGRPPQSGHAPTSPSSTGRPASPTSPRLTKIPKKKPGANMDKPKKDVTFEDTKADKKGVSGGGAGGLTSLSGLPSLRNGGRHGGERSAPSDQSKTTKTPNLEKDNKAIDRRIADLGFDVPDDDYDDDFESSKSEKGDPRISPFGVTPRSARSDHNVKSIEDEVEEEIEEDLSVAEDLLRSDNSGMDDLTTDRTVSPDNQNSAIDYMEDVMVP